MTRTHLVLLYFAVVLKCEVSVHVRCRCTCFKVGKECARPHGTCTSMAMVSYVLALNDCFETVDMFGCVIWLGTLRPLKESTANGVLVSRWLHAAAGRGTLIAFSFFFLVVGRVRPTLDLLGFCPVFGMSAKREAMWSRPMIFWCPLCLCVS